MGDIPTEDIMAEPEEIKETFLSLALGLLHAYGWYIILALLGIYFYWKQNANRASTSASSGVKSPKELQDWQAKEEQRLKVVARLQEQYAKDAEIKAARQKELEEEKRKAKLEEKQKLAGIVDCGQKLGDGDKKSKSLRPEFNPLMGDSGSSGRVCFRRPGGGGGGG